MAYNFETYEEIAQYPDCKYALDVNDKLSSLTQRIESLNIAGSMIWPNPIPSNFKEFPVDRHAWLTIAADVFLMRYVSVVDCALLLTNAVFQCDIEEKKCSIENLKKKCSSVATIKILEKLIVTQGALRLERNRRFHHGRERGFSQDDIAFRTASIFEHRLNGMSGFDRLGRKLDLLRLFKEGLVELQRDFNVSTRKLVRDLNELYDLLSKEFEYRFVPLFRSPNGFGAK